MNTNIIPDFSYMESENNYHNYLKKFLNCDENSKFEESVIKKSTATGILKSFMIFEDKEYISVMNDITGKNYKSIDDINIHFYEILDSISPNIGDDYQLENNLLYKKFLSICIEVEKKAIEVLNNIVPGLDIMAQNEELKNTEVRSGSDFEIKLK